MIRDKALVRELNNFFPSVLSEIINDYDIDFPDKTHKRKMSFLTSRINCEFSGIRWALNEMMPCGIPFEIMILPGIQRVMKVGNYRWQEFNIKEKRFSIRNFECKILGLVINREKFQIEFVRNYIHKGFLIFNELNNEWRERYNALIKHHLW